MGIFDGFIGQNKAFLGTKILQVPTMALVGDVWAGRPKRHKTHKKRKKTNVITTKAYVHEKIQS